MDDRPHTPLLCLSYTEPAEAPIDGLQALVRPANDGLADEFVALDDYALAVRSERSADLDDYAPGYADDLDLDPVPDVEL